jgi:hypothetical protein
MSTASDPHDEQGPSILAQASSFICAVVVHTLDDCRIAPPEVQAERERLCRACPLHDAVRDRCNVCGCNLSLKWTWASSACPLPYPEWMAV